MRQDEQETDTKNRTSRNSASDLTNPLEMVKKTFQAFESLNSDVRARSYAQLTIFGHDEQETDAKKRSSRISAFELTNPLQMVKKHFRLLNRSILMYVLEVRPKLRFWAKMSKKQKRKIGLHEIQLLSSRTPYKW